MDTYKVAIPVKITRLPRADDKTRSPIPAEVRDVHVRILAHNPEDAAERLSSALSDLLQRVGSK